MKRGPDDRASINLPNAAWAVSRQMEHEPVADGGTRRLIGKLVDGVLEALAGRELRHVACRDVNFRTRGRVAALAGFAARYGEIAEADEADVAAVLQFALNGLKNCINGRRRICLRESGLVGYGSHELIFVHVSTPFMLVRNDCLLKAGLREQCPRLAIPNCA